LSILQPENVATPATAGFGFAVQVSVAPFGEVSLRVTGLTLVVSTLPPASLIVTAGWVVSAVPLTPLLGWVLNEIVPVEASVRLGVLVLVAVQLRKAAVTANVKLPAGTVESVQEVAELVVRLLEDVPQAGAVAPSLVRVRTTKYPWGAVVPVGVNQDTVTVPAAKVALAFVGGLSVPVLADAAPMPVEGQ
jgi:hypothetical protein